MYVLILGGGGYVGSALTEYLVSKSFDVNFVDLNWFSPSLWGIDYNDLDEAYLSSYDAIILLAGHSSVKMCENNLISTYNNNVRNFASLLSKISHQRVIYASSASVYGEKHRLYC